ncbi:MAG: T9SS type A sorting domain-containing protein [Candidatus Paceibacterota bacterium]|jgi:hypothetical protein
MLVRFFILWLIISPVVTNAQNWQGIGGIREGANCIYEDTIENEMYIGGYFYLLGVDNIRGIAKWDGNNFLSLGLNMGATVTAITKYNNEIYVGGYNIYLFGKFRHIAKWNGITWDTVGTGVNGSIYCFKEINNELYVGGTFDSAGTIHVNSLAKWNGSNWSDVNSFPMLWTTPDINYVLAIANYNDELYIGGNFDNDTISDIIKFNGSSWVNVGGGMHGGMSGLEDMVVYKDELYISGAFYLQDGNVGNFIQRWNGTQWKDVGGGTLGLSGSISDNGQIHDMKIHNGELYIGGIFSYAGGVPAKYIAKWDGSKWCGLGGNFDNRITAIGWDKDTLYVSGGFWTIDGDSILRIAKWIGGSYIDTCSQSNSIPEIINESNLSIYPNPANTSFEITTENEQIIKEVELYTIEGKLLKQQNYSANKVKVNTSQLPQGMYIIEVQTKEKQMFQKLIISH